MAADTASNATRKSPKPRRKVGQAIERDPDGDESAQKSRIATTAKITPKPVAIAQAVDLPEKSDSPEQRLQINRDRTKLFHGKKRRRDVSGAALQ